jgi:hypothetical protein
VSALPWGIHFEVDPPREYEDGEPCDGQVLVIAQDDVLWTLECQKCMGEAGIPAHKADPATHTARILDRRRNASGLPEALRGVALPEGGSPLEMALRHWGEGRIRGLLITGPSDPWSHCPPHIRYLVKQSNCGLRYLNS